MRKILMAAAGILFAIVPHASAGAADGILPDDDDPVPSFRFPAIPSLPQLPGARGPSAAPGVTTPLVPPLARAPAPAPQSRAEILDDLFHRLAGAADPSEARGLASRIERVWLQSGSDTADLLMSRAASVSASGQPNVALQLLDKVVALNPGWVEGWNKRATLRFLADDDRGSMEDIAHVLALEPRHFGALNGMAMILQRHGLNKPALDVMRKAAVIYPHNADLEKQIDDLTLEVEGRPI